MTDDEPRQGDDQLWGLLWSRDQGALHVERIGENIRRNLEVLNGALERSDHVLLWIGTHPQVRAKSDEMAPFVRAKREADSALRQRKH